MVDPDRLLNVRTVEYVGTVEGTKVGDRVLSTDVDTLFPLQAALGYDITQSLLVGTHTLLVEGDLTCSICAGSRKNCRHSGGWALTTLDNCPGRRDRQVRELVTLFGGTQLHVAVLTNFHQGDKKKVRDLRESEVLRQGHVLMAEAYALRAEADIEDIIGRDIYVALVNQTYGLTAKTRLPAKKPSGADACRAPTLVRRK